MKSKRSELIALLVLLVFFSVGIVSSWRWSAGPRLYAELFAVPGLVLTIIAFIRLLVAARKGPVEAPSQPNVSLRKEVDFFGWMIGYTIATWLFGFIAASLSFVFFYMISKGQKWWMSTGYTVSTGLVLWYLFDKVFQLNWIDGIVWFWLGL